MWLCRLACLELWQDYIQTTHHHMECTVRRDILWSLVMNLYHCMDICKKMYTEEAYVCNMESILDYQDDNAYLISSNNNAYPTSSNDYAYPIFMMMMLMHMILIELVLINVDMMYVLQAIQQYMNLISRGRHWYNHYLRLVMSWSLQSNVEGQCSWRCIGWLRWVWLYRNLFQQVALMQAVLNIIIV